jgi:hypothetical protein
MHVERDRQLPTVQASVGRLLQLIREAAFVETERRDGLLFQPVLIGIRPSE